MLEMGQPMISLQKFRHHALLKKVASISEDIHVSLVKRLTFIKLTVNYINGPPTWHIYPNGPCVTQVGPISQLYYYHRCRPCYCYVAIAVAVSIIIVMLLWLSLLLYTLLLLLLRTLLSLRNCVAIAIIIVNITVIYY